MNKSEKAEFERLLRASSFKEPEKHAIWNMLETATTPKPKQPRIRNSKAPQLQSLFEWEASQGSQLCAQMIAGWISEKEFCPKLISQMIEEFRLEMIGKNKQYADFKATFQTYLNKGYLSKKVGQMALANSPYKSSDGVQIHSRGVRI